MKNKMRLAKPLAAGTLLMTMSLAAMAGEPRPGQAGIDTMRDQAMTQLRSDNLASLQPRIERNLVAANQSAAPRQMVAAGMPLPGPTPNSVAR
jgi:hypothetical protein